MNAAWRIRLVLPLVALAALLILTSVAGIALARALQRPVVYQYFDQALARSPEVASAVTWATGPQLDRRFGPVERVSVGRALTEAWALHAAALATGETRYLADRFSGTALARAIQSAETEGARMVVLHQTQTPQVFHRNGSVLQVAGRALTARFVLKDGDLAEYRLTQDETVTTLLNEASGWHVVWHERHWAKAVAARRAPILGPKRLAGVNYYPAATPWNRFWPAFDLGLVQRDLALIRGLGANAVRIFLQRDAFLDPTVADTHLDHLRAFLRVAEGQGLQVVPVLFDLRGGYEPSHWADDYILLQRVLPVLADAPNVAFVDLKNEADLDFALYGRGLVQAWLTTMAAAAHEVEPGLPLTIGWSSAEAAQGMIDLVDVVTFHDFLDPATAGERLAQVRAAAGDKPVMVTEIGASSFTLAAGFPSSPAAQARALTDHGRALGGADGLFVWTLHDFPNPDLAVVGRWPWHKSLQEHYGLYDAAGQEKPAAAAVRSLFSLTFQGQVP